MSHAALTVSPCESASHASENAPRQAIAIHATADTTLFMPGSLRAAPAGDKSWRRSGTRRCTDRLPQGKFLPSQPRIVVKSLSIAVGANGRTDGRTSAVALCDAARAGHSDALPADRRLVRVGRTDQRPACVPG